MFGLRAQEKKKGRVTEDQSEPFPHLNKFFKLRKRKEILTLTLQNLIFFDPPFGVPEE